MNCQNCKRVLSCGCQQKIASNGKACCGTCVTKVEVEIKQLKKK